VTQASHSSDRFNVQTGADNTNFFGGIHFHGERLTSIMPIEDKEVAAQERETLSHEFYRGISARYEHILAAVDQPRPDKLNEIAQKFRERRVVIVHGASGQGKTTLAYRYLHDCVPHHRRFQVQVVEGRQHATNLANALIAQANESDSVISVYVDVAPNDVGWEELVKQLSHHLTIQTLVTIREEDFRRASISGTELQFAPVELAFNRSEAEEIYHFLTETERPPHILDFEDAWKRFGDEGPLLEFVYLVTQGDSLKEKLRQQIQRIENEIRAGIRSEAELQLLRLVSVAAASEARLQVKELVRFLQLPAAQRTLEVMEKEYYLLRTLENGTLVGGIHPVRSAILASRLTDPTFHPWVDSAIACLPFIVEPDINSFLLYAFLHDQAELEPLLMVLNTYHPKRWGAIAGVVRALIWLGIKDYVVTNQQLISDVHADCRQGWGMILDGDVANASPGVLEGLLSTLTPLFDNERQQQIEALRSRQTDKWEIFVPAFNWLSRLTQAPLPPHSESEWTGMAEVLFWVGQLQVPLPISDWLSLTDLEDVVETLPLATLADLALGLFYGYEAGYRAWLTQHQARLISRFRQETQTVAWEDDGQTVRSHFVIELFRPEQPSEAAQAIQNQAQRGFIDLAMERLELCRKLFPDREVFSSRGYGHRNPIIEFHDETEKNIPLANFPLQQLVSLNATFRGRAEQAFRPNSWEEYTRNVVDLRQSIIQSLQQLKQGLEVYFRSRQTTQILGQHIDSDGWTRSRQLLASSPLLPRCAFDAWGFISDSCDRADESDGNVPYQRQNLALEVYSSYLKALNSYIHGCSSFCEQAEWVLNFQPYFRNGENAQVQEIAQQLSIDVGQKAHLSAINLGDAWKAVPKLQREFRKFLSSWVSVETLNELEHQEQAAFDQLWCSWYFFIFHPTQQFQNATWGTKQEFSKQIRAIRNNIKKELRRISQNTIQASILSEKVLWEAEPALWLQVDGETPIEVYNAVEAIVGAIRQAIIAVPQSELRRYAIDFTWSTILVVPLIQGKSIASQTWRFSSIMFSVDPNSDLGHWHFVPVPVPADVLSQLGLSAWMHPRLDIAQQFMGSVSGLSLLAAHLQDFERLPELDGQGRDILQPYIHECATQLSACFQAVLDTASELLSYYNQFLPQDLAKHPYLILAIQGFTELHEHIKPITDRRTDSKLELSMSLAEFTEWANRLESIQRLTFLIYLCWVSDILQEAKNENT
jgi:hypothetical protein